MAMQTVKRFVCYYAGINLVLAALLLAVAWFSPDDAEPLAAPTGISNVSLQDQGAAAPLPAKRT
jgi:hypothetical protein